MPELILASQSPRRRALLEEAGFQFRVHPVKVSEIIDENLNLRAAIEVVAERKAWSFVEHNKHLISHDFLVLSADTCVVLEGRVLGKPSGVAEARHFLASLSNRVHEVITGMSLVHLVSQRVVTCSDQTIVEFHSLTKDEVEAYLKTDEPYDKAGAYGIQGRGGRFVKSIKGSFTNVMGLPMELLEKVLSDNDWRVPRRTP